METKDTRRKRKLELLIGATAGGIDAIAVATQLHPQYIKQIIKGSLLPPKRDGTRSARALGDAAAECIEDAYGLGRGWFDSQLGLPSAMNGIAEPEPAYKATTWPFTTFTATQYAALKPKTQALIEAMALQFINAEAPEEKYATPERRAAAR